MTVEDAAGFQDAKDRHDRVEGALEADGDPIARLEAGIDAACARAGWLARPAVDKCSGCLRTPPPSCPARAARCSRETAQHPWWTAASSLLLSIDETRDLRYRVEVVGHDLLIADGNRIFVLEMTHQLQDAGRIDDAELLKGVLVART